MADERGAGAEQEQDALLSVEAAEQKRARSWKRAGLVAVPCAGALIATMMWASSTPRLRPPKELMDPEYAVPLEVQADDLEFITDEASEMYFPTNGNTNPNVGYTQSTVNTVKAKSARCVLCNPNQCTLDYSGKGAWTSCPPSAPYFSEAHCKCVKSNVCQDPSPVLSTCSLCPDCSKRACVISGKYLQCPPPTPFYMASKKLCASSCQPSPGPAPPPYQHGSGTAHSDVSVTTPPPPTGPTPWLATTPRPGPVTPVTPVTPATINATCEEDTGGKCSMWGCSSSRGKTTCKSGKCLCSKSKGYCAHKGKCVKASTLLPPPPSSTTSTATCKSSDTGTSCRWSSCDSNLGKVDCDGMTNGMGSYKCKCKKHYCYDSTLKKCVKTA
ncbi:unnamed protein product [Symbiodinium natans]|uniref:Uncharacterized protein n=1 Tax=Symbiodinium natans TaxID=878477 RepID=A0A812UYF7_9DINO|nr:unnamed protein product [Symbiodinium natans]